VVKRGLLALVPFLAFSVISCNKAGLVEPPAKLTSSNVKIELSMKDELSEFG
jgi:hypothetical protein